MSRAEVSSSEGSSRLAAAPAVDGDLAFPRRFAGPLVLLARAMLVYIFLMDGWYQVTHYAEVGDYMSQNGVAPALLPLVILTHLGGGILVLIGVKARWAGIALMGFCLLAALFFHMGADQANDFGKNIAIAGGFLALATFGPGPWLACPSAAGSSSQRMKGGRRPLPPAPARAEISHLPPGPEARGLAGDRARCRGPRPRSRWPRRPRPVRHVRRFVPERLRCRRIYSSRATKKSRLQGIDWTVSRS